MAPVVEDNAGVMTWHLKNPVSPKAWGSGGEAPGWVPFLYQCLLAPLVEDNAGVMTWHLKNPVSPKAWGSGGEAPGWVPFLYQCLLAPLVEDNAGGTGSFKTTKVSKLSI